MSDLTLIARNVWLESEVMRLQKNEAIKDKRITDSEAEVERLEQAIRRWTAETGWTQDGGPMRRLANLRAELNEKRGAGE